MPTYEYYCEQCDTRFDAYQKFSDAPLTNCPQGHQPVRRVFTPAGIIFKGSGWYSTDSKASSTASSTPTNGKGEAKSEPKEGKSESAPEKTASQEPAAKETKSDAKTEAA
jgi:putative FmdB family regulatory protein